MKRFAPALVREVQLFAVGLRFLFIRLVAAEFRPSLRFGTSSWGRRPALWRRPIEPWTVAVLQPFYVPQFAYHAKGGRTIGGVDIPFHNVQHEAALIAGQSLV